ncbi:MAG: glycerol-3-phosphate dehydrogenase, partial [Candidatus Omnitrophica bacterium]|nr:glycerol-3-phosphate dehydrogenase [Candidatus Omnitrophota bacterium]
MNISILGDGGWGTALAILLHRKDCAVTLWSQFSSYAAYLNRKRINTKFLPGIKIPRGIKITHNLREAINEKELVVLAIPSLYLRSILKKIRQLNYSHESLYLSVIKGIEMNSLKRMSEVIYDELGKVRLAVLSGPTIAHEVAKGIPSTAVIASHDKKIRKYLQGIFMTD